MKQDTCFRVFKIELKALEFAKPSFPHGMHIYESDVNAALCCIFFTRKKELLFVFNEVTTLLEFGEEMLHCMFLQLVCSGAGAQI